MIYWALVVIAAALTSVIAFAIGSRAKPVTAGPVRIHPHLAEGIVIFVGMVLSSLVTNHYQAMEARQSNENLRGMFVKESEKVHSLMQLIAQALRDLRASNPNELPLTIAAFEAAVIREYGPLPLPSGLKTNDGSGSTPAPPKRIDAGETQPSSERESAYERSTTAETNRLTSNANGRQHADGDNATNSQPNQDEVRTKPSVPVAGVVFQRSISLPALEDIMALEVDTAPLVCSSSLTDARCTNAARQILDVMRTAIPLHGTTNSHIYYQIQMAIRPTGEWRNMVTLYSEHDLASFSHRDGTSGDFTNSGFFRIDPSRGEKLKKELDALLGSGSNPSMFEDSRTRGIAGHAGAQYEMGVYYEDGGVVPRDLSKAKEWYRKAAAQGMSEAKQKVAELEQSR